MMNPKLRQKGVKYTMGRQLYDNEHTSDCIFLSAGSVMNAVDWVWSGRVDSAFANVRPPGHHASYSQIGGFCYVNNIAIAARHAQEHLGAKKIAILDWDVHHGNGTQDIFKTDPNVLYMSIHRYDNGTFYPYLKDSSSLFLGENEGKGFNVNIAWDTETPKELSAISDGDYKLAFDGIIDPMLDQFRPDLVLVSAGFDAMLNDPVGNLSLTPDIYAYMSYMLKNKHKVVLALEGGYNLETMQNAAYASVRGLIRKDIDFSRYNPERTEIGRQSLANTIEVAQDYWDVERYDLEGN
jgi:histone deacetylase 6